MLDESVKSKLIKKQNIHGTELATFNEGTGLTNDQYFSAKSYFMLDATTPSASDTAIACGLPVNLVVKLAENEGWQSIREKAIRVANENAIAKDAIRKRMQVTTRRNESVDALNRLKKVAIEKTIERLEANEIELGLDRMIQLIKEEEKINQAIIDTENVKTQDGKPRNSTVINIGMTLDQLKKLSKSEREAYRRKVVDVKGSISDAEFTTVVRKEKQSKQVSAEVECDSQETLMSDAGF